MTAFEEAVRCSGCGGGIEVYEVWTHDPNNVRYMHKCGTPSEEMQCDCGNYFALFIEVVRSHGDVGFCDYWFCDSCGDVCEGDGGLLTGRECVLVGMYPDP